MNSEHFQKGSAKCGTVMHNELIRTKFKGRGGLLMDGSECESVYLLGTSPQ
jgi:hypothetical protein